MEIWKERREYKRVEQLRPCLEKHRERLQKEENLWRQRLKREEVEKYE